MHPSPLRPRRAGEILDAAFRFVRAEYVALVLGSAAFILPSALLSLLVPAWQVLWNILGQLLYLAASVVPVILVLDHYLGRPTDVADALRSVMRRFGSVWGASLVSGLLTFGALLLLIVPGVIVFARLFAMPGIVLAEGATAGESFERSKELTRGHTLHVLSTLGVAYLIFWLAFIGAGMGIGFLGGIAGLGEAAIGFLVEVVIIALYPFVGVVSALLYLDLRVRTEALDLQLIAEALPADPPAAAPV